MRLWAFGVSPHGLGLAPEAFWCLSRREFEALVEVAERPVERWAQERADYRNVYFKGKDDAPWTPDDFLGRGDYAKRQATYKRDQMMVARENLRLEKMKPGEVPAGIPAWARGKAN